MVNVMVNGFSFASKFNKTSFGIDTTDFPFTHSEIVGKYAKFDVLDVNGKPVERI